tara:strand:+ start:5829 stop:5960 length:132 start_codon:yes stop_codon:yes gene_type:complete
MEKKLIPLKAEHHGFIRGYLYWRINIHLAMVWLTFAVFKNNAN